MIQPVSSVTIDLTGLRPIAGAGRRPEPAAEHSNEHTAATQAASPSYELADEQRRVVQQLRQADRRIRQHEAAHQAAAGQYAMGGPSYQYRTGPDGRRYAVAGEVQIDTSPIPGDPEATIRKMQQVRRAALAPGQPSSQDLAVAARASQVEQQARAERTAQRNQPDQSHPAGLGQTLNVYA